MSDEAEVRVENRRGRTWQAFSSILLIVAGVSFLAYQSWSLASARARVQSAVKLNELKHVAQAVETTRKFYSGPFSALAITSTLGGVGFVVDGDESFRPALEHVFHSIAESQLAISLLQIRDGSGRAILRVERRGRSVDVIDRTVLQSDGERDPIPEEWDGRPGDIFVSGVYLKTKNGEVEVPWMPTTRFTAPYRSASGQNIAFIDMDVNMARFFFDLTLQQDTWQDDLMLLSPDGSWIFGEESEKLWAFMTGHDKTFAAAHPEVWNFVNGTGRGALERDGAIWTFQKIRVVDIVPFASQYEIVNPNDVLWIVVVRVPVPRTALTVTEILIPIGIVALMILVSYGWLRAIRRREEDRQRMSRERSLASLGSLVAGLAHELNGPIGNAILILSSIQGTMENLLEQTASGSVSGSDFSEFLESTLIGSRTALTSMKRGADLMQRFKRISADQASEERRPFLLDPFLDDVVETIRHQFKHRSIALQTEFGFGGEINSYAGALSQVIFNLLQNVLAHAFEGEETGTATVLSEGKGSRNVQITVEDNGRGIPSSLLHRVFDPFFTTKMGRGGTGLGLNLVYNLVTKMLGGKITVSSGANDHKTRFVVTLPVTAPLHRILPPSKRKA